MMHKSELLHIAPVDFLPFPNPCHKELGRVTLDLAHCRDEIDYWRQLARTDVVTGLSNRLAFHEDLAEYTADVEHDTRRRVGVGFIDLDEFKNANDRYGHDYGDEILKLTAVTLRQSVSQYGMLYRTGGDEFAILFQRVKMLRNDPEGNMLRYATDLEESLSSAYSESSLRRQGLKIGASIAIVRSIVGESSGSILKRADDAMYKRKRTKTSSQ